MMMRTIFAGTRSRRLRLAALAAIPLALGLAAVSSATPADDDLPNPWPNRRADWAKLPPTVPAWAAVVGALPGRDGLLYVVHRCHENSCVDRPEPPVIVFDPSGRPVRSWGQGELAFPHGFFIDRRGDIWITDAAGAGRSTGKAAAGQGSQVRKYDRKGRLLMTIGTAGRPGDPGDGLLTQPTAVITNRKGEIFVAEGHDGDIANRISKFAPDGKFIRTIIEAGSGPGAVRIPHCLAFDEQERLMVCDRGNNRVQVFDQEGRPLASWPQWGRPSGIFIAGDRMYVTDSESGGDRNPGWKKGIRIGSASTGMVDAFVPDLQPTVADPAGAEQIAIYRGTLFASVVRRRALETLTPESRKR